MYATRSQTDETKLEYSTYQQMTQQSSAGGYLGQESDFGAKDEPTLFSVSSQPPQPQTPHPQQQSQQSVGSPSDHQAEPQDPEQQPTLADYNQSTSKGHEILSQVCTLEVSPACERLYLFCSSKHWLFSRLTIRAGSASKSNY